MKNILFTIFMMFLMSNVNSQSNMYEFTDISVLDKKELKEVKLEKDDFKGITFIKPKGFMSETYKIEPYLSHKDGKVSFRIKLKYYGKDWVFHNKVLIIIDDEVSQFNVKPDREVEKGNVSEISDIRLNDEDIELFKKIADSPKDVKIRFEGDKISDQYIYKLERNYLKKLITFFEKNKK